jgi:hypothetical protein
MGELNPKTISRFVAECSIRYTNEAFKMARRVGNAPT